MNADASNASDALKRAIMRVAELSAETKPVWIIGGSAGLMLRGAALPAAPRDLDLYADRDDAARLHVCLAAYAIDEQTLSITAMYESQLSHYSIEETAVELVGGFVVSARGCRYETSVQELLMHHAERLVLSPGSEPVALVPLAHELIFNWLRGREDRVGLISELMALDPPRHYPPLAAILEANRIADDAAAEVWRILPGGEAGGSVG